ncbi:MAG: hypothetical protein AAF706_03620, partial [Bacteroidota bacterium]
NNPYVSGVDCVYTTYTGEKRYNQAAWVDVTGLSVDLNYSVKKLILCSICIGANSHANVGFRFCDDNGVLQPMRTKTQTREPVHFSVEANPGTTENQSVWTFHMVANCHGKVKLQVRVDDTGEVTVNSVHDQRDRPFNHATISTLTVLSLNNI